MSCSVYLSTGALVGKRNNYNYYEVIRTVPALMSEGVIDASELMVIKLWYEKFPSVLQDFLKEGCKFPVIHSDKDIGTALSDAAVMAQRGEIGSESRRRQSVDMFKQCCEWGEMAGSSRLVLHLWGGLNSDYAVQYNIETLPLFCEIAKQYGIKILCENVPSAKEDPLSNWLRLKDFLGEIGLIFDTRFATCHRQPKETLTDKTVSPYIEHVHISDYRGGLKEFSCLRPVFHPGEGIADFPLMFSYLRNMNVTYTLESPGISGWDDDRTDINTDKIKKSVDFIRQMQSNG